MIQPQDIETELLAFLRRDIFSSDIQVTPETDLVGSGFDSMSLVKTLLHVEATYGKWISEGEITGEALANVRSLAQAVARGLNDTQKAAG
jgi:acyl carrier protein